MDSARSQIPRGGMLPHSSRQHVTSRTRFQRAAVGTPSSIQISPTHFIIKKSQGGHELAPSKARAEEELVLNVLNGQFLTKNTPAAVKTL